MVVALYGGVLQHLLEWTWKRANNLGQDSSL